MKTTKYKILPEKGKYMLISDLHLGIGDGADDAAHNQHIIFYLLRRCLEEKTHVVMLGDVFELAENKSIEPIKNTHDHIMWLLSELDKNNLLTYVRGNHDAYVKEEDIATRLNQYNGETIPFLKPEIYDSVEIGKYYCIHGHQTEWQYNCWFNHVINWLLRVGWHNLQKLICKDPSSDVQGWQKSNKVDEQLNNWGKTYGAVVVAGHTHKCKRLTNYYNIGSFAVLPRCSTYGILENGEMKIMKCQEFIDKTGDMKIVETEIKW